MKKIIVLMLVLMMTFTVNTYADNQVKSLMSNIGNAGEFVQTGNMNVVGSEMHNLIVGLTNLGLVIGTIVAIAAGIIIAIKFMTNSVEGKADMKQALTPYIIGVSILFGAYGIWAIIVNLFFNIK